MLFIIILLLLPFGSHSIPPIVTSAPPGLSVSEGGHFTLNCSHNQSDAVFWTDSSGAILTSQLYNSTNQLTASYIIQSADRSLNGSTFQCVANVTGSTQEFSEVTLQILFIANSTVSLRQSEVRIGETVFLSCETDSWPPASIRWEHSGANLGSSNQLSVPVTSSSVGGIYTCIATNSEGMSGIRMTSLISVCV